MYLSDICMRRSVRADVTLPKFAVRLRARRRVERRRRVDVLELHLVEQVVDLPAVLQLLVALQADVLEEGEVVVVPAGQHELPVVAGGFIACISTACGRPHVLCIEPAIDILVAAGELQIANDVERPCAARIGAHAKLCPPVNSAAGL